MSIRTMPDDASGSGYFAGQLLIATPSLSDGCFDRAVVYLCEHNAEGAMGVIVNHPIANVQFGEILEALDLVGASRSVTEQPVFFGGPVDAHRGFVLHSDDIVLDDSVINASGIALTANVNMLKEIAEGKGPKNGLLALGYAGWSAGQLESEIEAGAWITAPATPELVFDVESDLLWTRAAASLGVDLARFSSAVGHA